MMMVKASLLAFVALLAVACAAPSVFLGGQFSQMDGVWSQKFAAFNTASQKWSHYPIGLPTGTINSLAAVRNGTFAVGTFTHVGSSESQHVAFWDGVKWCPIRQGINGPGLAVVCDSDTSCWVAGTFTAVFNLDVVNQPTNFVHYDYNTATHEWEIDLDALTWNNATADPLVGIDADSLDYIGSGSNLFFFAKSGDTIYRGSDADNGWFTLAGPTSVNAGASRIFDASLNPDGTSLYVVTDVAANAIFVLTGSRVTGGCGGSCGTPTTPADWNSVVSGAPYNGTLFNSFSAIVAGPSDTRYLIGVYDPDGADTEFEARPRVLQQVGTGVPTLIGSPFDVGTNPVLTSIGLTETNGPLVLGTFFAANLFYPTTPSTTDVSGLTGDRRPLDLINGIAVYDTTLTRWVPFGAGGVSGTPSGNVRMTYNSLTKEWFLADNNIGYGYDLHAVDVVYHETTDDAFFPVLTRAVVSRHDDLGLGTVYEVICETSDCGAVFVGGDFAFHGPDTFGAILRAVVKSSGEPELSAVGGGLWDSTIDHYLNDSAYQLGNGKVYALTTASGFLYAGGEFSRTAPGSGFHCLGNIARIDASALTGQWEDLAGGCDSAVYDLEEYQGRLYVGGAFAKCGDVIVNYVASYSYGDATPAWSSLNHGVDSNVYSLEPFQGRLIVGGQFNHAGGLPVPGVASWDGSKWRALIPACTDDCVAGGLDFYYNVLNFPSSVHSLQRDSTGNYLFGNGQFDSGRYLVRWQYTEGDFGQWLVKGKVVRTDQPLGHGVAIFVDDQILVAGEGAGGVIGDENPNLGAWDQNAENIAVTNNVGGSVYVVRGPAGGSAGSASTLSSMLSPLLAYVF